MITPRATLLGTTAILACALVALLVTLIALRAGAEGSAVQTVEQLGGNVIRDPQADGHPVVSVELGNTLVRDADLKELRAFAGLRTLHLLGTDVTDVGLRDVKELKGLQTLNLRRTRVTDAGLTELQGLPDLRELDLGETDVTDAGLKELRGLRSLRTLDVTRTRVTDAGVAGLHATLPDVKITH
jgi:hypothetical protein